MQNSWNLLTKSSCCLRSFLLFHKHIWQSLWEKSYFRCPYELSQRNNINNIIEYNTGICIDCFLTCDSDGLEISLEPVSFTSNEKCRNNSNLNLEISGENDSVPSDSSPSTESYSRNDHFSIDSIDSLMIREVIHRLRGLHWYSSDEEISVF